MISVTALETLLGHSLFMQCVSMPVQSYRDLVAWQKSFQLVLAVYRGTQVFPKTETYGLVTQLRRAAVSIPSNIAEGHARTTTGEFKHFLGIAMGSLAEVETQILLCQSLGYVAAEDSESLLESGAEVGKIIHGLLRALKN